MGCILPITLVSGLVPSSDKLVDVLFGRADITRCLQHKRDQVCKANGDGASPAGSNISGGDPPPEVSKDGVDPLAEPSPTLPLWRRVDRQFWWNEWLSKLFIDAGVWPWFRLDGFC